MRIPVPSCLPVSQAAVGILRAAVGAHALTHSPQVAATASRLRRLLDVG